MGRTDEQSGSDAEPVFLLRFEDGATRYLVCARRQTGLLDEDGTMIAQMRRHALDRAAREHNERWEAFLAL